MPQPEPLNRLNFNIDPLTFFIKSIIAGLSTLIYIPAAEQLTKLLQYATSCMSFPDGTTITYTGKESDLKQPLLPVTIFIWAQIILSAIIEDPFLDIGLSVASSLASAYVGYQLLRVITPLLQTSNGSRLNFSATIEDYIRWQLIILACTLGPTLLTFLLPSTGFFSTILHLGLALVSLVLLVMMLIPFYKWFASKITGGTRLANFDAEPIELGGMLIGFILFSCLILTIPWSIAWFTKWMLNRFSLPARSAMATGSYSG